MTFSPTIGSLEVLCREDGSPMGYSLEAHDRHLLVGSLYPGLLDPVDMTSRVW